MKNNTVHIAFGFHVNCYHSYRGDTNDAAGFGSDIKIMRHTIQNLDAWNQQGIPVKGTWDFENAYSLEEILPEYAPDIIADVRRRCEENGDENILMGYNNGAMSAMTRDEFLASVRYAVHNKKGSGLEDLFGSYAPVIRPQEVMFTPSEAALYREAGIEAVCLYYSCVPFDAFRTIIPQLDDEEAFNPLTYAWQDSSITVLPTYSQSDLMDAGSLRWLTCDLHRQQEAGTIHHDVFLFINIDADSFLWEPLPAPHWLQKKPNCGGLNGLVEEVKNLDFIVFDTPYGYLKDHAPLGTITFGEDVADGNFSGYASWAEKPFNRTIWTRLERARRMAAVRHLDGDSASFDTRIRLLSTTHFGLASPVLNITRETKALQLSQQMIEEEKSCFAENVPLRLEREDPQTLFTVQLQIQKGFCDDIATMHLCSQEIRTYVLIPMHHYEDGSLESFYLIARTKEPCTSLSLNFQRSSAAQQTCDESSSLTAGGLTVKTSEHGTPVWVHDNMAAVEIESYLTYDGQKIPFALPEKSMLRLGGQGKGIRYAGEIHLPYEVSAGWYRYDFIQCDALDALIIDCEIQYPYTKETDSISTSASSLGRCSDARWKEAVPFGMKLIRKDSVRLTKRNFMNSLSAYPLSDFWNCRKENADIASFNQQLTGGLLDLRDDSGGLAVAHARMVSGSMAHCPMRLETIDGMRRVTMNPFGTYFGRQRSYPTRGNGCVMDLYNRTMPQAQSLAPAYNGAHEEFVLAAVWREEELPDACTKELCLFADGVIAHGGNEITACTLDNSLAHGPQKNAVEEKHLKGFSSYSDSKLALVGTVLRLLYQIRRAETNARKYLSSRPAK